MHSFFLLQIRSDADKEVIVTYEITGKGFDDGLFEINRNNGELYVTQPLDREEQDRYLVGEDPLRYTNIDRYAQPLHANNLFLCTQLQAHAEIAGKGKAEDAMDIIVIVIDQNDNRPIFTEAQFVGEVAEVSPKGTATQGKSVFLIMW